MNSQIKDESPIDSKSIVKVLGWYTLFYAVSLAGYFGSTPGLWYWYVTLRRPEWAPPGWGFTAAWTVLYGLIATASWQVRQAHPSRTRTAGLVLLAIQLALAVIWPWIFFTGHQVLGAFVLSIIVVGLALPTTVAYWIVRPSAGGMMLVQFLWTLFIAILTFTLWRINI